MTRWLATMIVLIAAVLWQQAQFAQLRREVTQLQDAAMLMGCLLMRRHTAAKD